MSQLRAFLFLGLRWILVLIVLAVLFYGFCFKPLLIAALEMNWDTEISIGRAHIDFQRPALILENLKVGNPYGFPRGDMLEISRVEMSLVQGEYRDGALKPERLSLIIEKVNLLRRVSGHLNLELFTEATAKKKQKGLKIAPWVTRFWVGEVSLTDASGPLLQKKDFELKQREFVFESKKNFGMIANAFSQKLLETIQANEEALRLPPPEYHSLASSVEQSLREQAAEKAEEESSVPLADEAL